MISVSDRPSSMRAFRTIGGFEGDTYNDPVASLPSSSSGTSAVPLLHSFKDGDDFSWSPSDPDKIYYQRARRMRVFCLGRVVFFPDQAGGSTGIFTIGIGFSTLGVASHQKTLHWAHQTLQMSEIYNVEQGNYLWLAAAQKTNVSMNIIRAELEVWSTGFSPVGDTEVVL